MTLREKIGDARARLVAAGIDDGEAGRDAGLLARHVLAWDRASLLANDDQPATTPFIAAFDPLIERRARREPVAYLRGIQEFWNREFMVTPAVLIPRPETELIIEELLARLPAGVPAAPQRIADIGTGSGCLAVTAAAERPCVQVTATDISEPALRVAQQNAGRYAVSHRIAFKESAYLTGTQERFDFILSNPPYVADRDYQSLQPEVRDYEPALALVAGEDGLRDIQQIVNLATFHLIPGGTMLIEIGYDQADAVVDLVAGLPALTLIKFSNDLQNIPRVAVIERKIIGQ